MKAKHIKGRRSAGVRRLLLWLTLSPIGVYAFLFVSGELWGSTAGRLILLVMLALSFVVALLWFSRSGT